MPHDAFAARNRMWLVAAAAAAVPVVAGAFLSTGWSWGWDHLHRAGAAWQCAALIALALVWAPAYARLLEGAAGSAGEALVRRPRLVAATLAALAFVVFAVFPIATKVYGDSLVYLRLRSPDTLLAYLRGLGGLGVHFRGSAVLALHEIVARLLRVDLAASYRLVGAACGAVFVFAHLRMASRLPNVSGWARSAIVWLGLVACRDCSRACS
jgi:hypothetical protein